MSDEERIKRNQRLMHRLVSYGRQRRPLRITYDDKDRVVEVHTVGLTRTSKPVARVYQIGEGWKLLSIEKIASLDEDRDGVGVDVRPGYNPEDSQIPQVFWRIADSRTPA